MQFLSADPVECSGARGNYAMFPAASPAGMHLSKAAPPAGGHSYVFMHEFREVAANFRN